MSDTFVAYCPTITGGKVLRFRATSFPPYDKNGTQVYPAMATQLTCTTALWTMSRNLKGLLLSFFSKNEGKYVVCRLAGLGLVLVYKGDYIDDRLELVVSTDLITCRTVVIDVADVEKGVCFLGDECVVSVA